MIVILPRCKQRAAVYGQVDLRLSSQTSMSKSRIRDHDLAFSDGARCIVFAKQENIDIANRLGADSVFRANRSIGFNNES